MPFHTFPDHPALECQKCRIRSIILIPVVVAVEQFGQKETPARLCPQCVRTLSDYQAARRKRELGIREG